MENWKMICLSFFVWWWVGWMKEWKEVIQWMIGNLLKQKIYREISFPPLPSVGWMNAVKFHEGCKKKQEAARWWRFSEWFHINLLFPFILFRDFAKKSDMIEILCLKRCFVIKINNRKKGGWKISGTVKSSPQPTIFLSHNIQK